MLFISIEKIANLYKTAIGVGVGGGGASMTSAATVVSGGRGKAVAFPDARNPNVYLTRQVPH